MSTTTAPPLMFVGMTLPRDPDLYVRDHERNLRLSLADAAIEHHDRHIPWHFESFGPAKYGYKKRGAKYQRIKDRMGLPPLVSPNPKTSGNLKQEVTYHYQITATQTRSRLIMRLPFQGGTGRLRLKAGQVSLTSPQEQILNRIAELSVIAPDERAYLADFIAGRYAMRAKLPGNRKRVRAGSS